MVNQGPSAAQVVGLIIVLTCALAGSGLCSRITFTNGVYNNLLVALHPDTDPANCVQLVQNISEAFIRASAYLDQATEGQARFGSIRILVPANWGPELPNCPIHNITNSHIYESYDDADFKVSPNHPFASRLPWTKQYKGCENESDSVFVPVQFLQSPAFDSEARGRILLQEWAKFRYGVFEEHGYFGDPIFSPCFSMSGKEYFTACTNVQLDALQQTGSEPISDDMCRSLLSQKSESLLEQLRTANSSIMFAPHLTNMVQFCSKSSTIGLAPTKHSVLCERKSVSEVVFSHEDFRTRASSSVDEEGSFFPNTRGGRTPRAAPIISLVRKDTKYLQGYVILFEDSAELRQLSRIQHVKQAIAQIVRLAKDQTYFGFGRYDGPVWSFTRPPTILASDNDRRIFLNKIPELNSLGLLDKYKVARSSRLDKDSTRSIQNILAELAVHSTIKWDIIQVTANSPPPNIAETLLELKRTDHSLSILTFDPSKAWMEFNSIPNTRKVIYLPRCGTEDSACQGKTSSFVVDYFAEILATNTSLVRHFTHKVVDFSFDGGIERSFTIPVNQFVQDIQNFQFFLPVYSNDTGVSVVSPSGNICGVTDLLGYKLVKTISCIYEAGAWKVNITGGVGVGGRRYTLQAYGETVGTDHDLIISASLGRKLTTEVYPSTGGLPVYVSVSNTLEQPVISASVELALFHENQNFSSYGSIKLLDNGIDPDLTSNDGIYSAFVSSYNSNPSYHTGQVWVRTSSGSSKAILSLSSSNGDAALLDPNMASKCCGSAVPVSQTSYVGNGAYSIVLPSFRTGESLNSSADFLPPSRISSPISMVENSLDHIILQFLAPGSNYAEGTVSSYNICCTNSSSGNLDDSMCQSVDRTDCVPVPSGSVQTCKILKSDLAAGFYNTSNSEFDDNSTELFLFCGLRGVDGVGSFGPLSGTIFEVPINIDAHFRTTSECKYISDGCLPIAVFWTLIGCLGGLILILFIVVLCWFCTSKKEKKADSEKSKAKADSDKSDRFTGRAFPDVLATQAPLHNVYINQAYIQDSNGQLKLVASDGELMPLESPDTPFRYSSASGVRRRSISEPDLDLPGSRKHVSWNGGEEPPKGMSVFSPVKPGPMSSSNRSLESPTSSKVIIPPPPSVMSKPDPRFAGLQSNFSRGSGPALNQNLGIPRAGSPQARSIPSISSMVELQDHNPVYASVARAGRKTSPYAAANQPFNQYPSSHSIPAPRAPTPERGPSTAPPRATAAPAGPTPKYIHNRPPVRMDHFPSSESEIYSDMSHVVPNNFARAGPAFNRHSPGRRPDGGHNSSPPKPAFLNPARVPGGRPKARDVTSNDIQRPKVIPPPPPPPRQSLPEANKGLPRQSQAEEEEYDDDSDNWDNYDDFQFENPGAGSSYA